MKQVVYIEACRRVLHRPGLMAAGCAGLAVLAGLVYWWLALPVARTRDLVLLAGLGLLALTLAALLGWKGLTILGQANSSLSHATRRATFWLAAAIGLGTGILLPWLLVKWVPDVDGLWLQAISMVIRFLIAGVCFTATVLWFGAVVAQLGETHGEDLPPAGESQDQAS